MNAADRQRKLEEMGAFIVTKRKQQEFDRAARNIAMALFAIGYGQSMRLNHGYTKADLQKAGLWVERSCDACQR